MNKLKRGIIFIDLDDPETGYEFISKIISYKKKKFETRFIHYDGVGLSALWENIRFDEYNRFITNIFVYKL